MQEKVNIFSNAWCDIVFDRKNKAYGAYELRKLSSRRHLISIILAVLLFLAAVMAPKLISMVFKEKVETDTTIRELTDLNQPVKEKKQEEIKEIIQQQKIVRNTVKFTPPVIKKDNEVKEEEEMKSQTDLNKTNTAISTTDIKGNTDDADVAVVTNTVLEDNTPPLDFAEQQPQFPGGVSELFAFLTKQLRYPDEALENQVSGTVYIKFTVSKTGKIKDAVVVRGVHPMLDKEAVRVVLSMPDWEPGRQGGTPVAVKYTIPIKFILN